MENSAPAGPAWSRITLAALIVALIGAVAYIYHLQGQVAQRTTPETAVGPTPTVQPVADATLRSVAPATAWAMTPQQEQDMYTNLTDTTATDRTVWFQIQANNQTTGAAQAALQRVFEKAGWTVRVARGPYGLKAGVFLLAADDTPTEAVEAVNRALVAAGIDVKYMTGYRSFVESRKANNPNWVGPELAKDQSFVIVIGSQPTPKPG